MKKTVIFFMALESDKKSKHHISATATFSIFLSKSKVILKFQEWVNKEKEEIDKRYSQQSVIINLKIIK